MVSAGLALGVMAVTGYFEPPKPAVERVANVASDGGSADLHGVPRLVATVSPSVVALRANSPSGERFGSGLVIGSDGYVLTNAHLVEGATSINLTADDGRSFTARSTGADPESDLAVLAVANADFVPAELGSSGQLRVGEMAVIIGARHRPQGSPSVTTGVIAGLGEVLEVGGRLVYDVIATDAFVAARASGGPVLDRHGAVVGISIRAAQSDGDEAGSGVIPIDRARQVAQQLIVSGKVAYPWVGLSGATIDAGIAARYGVDRGIIVREVEPESPADRGGLQVQDVVTAVQAAPVATTTDWTMLVRRHAPGDEIALTVVRSGRTRTVMVRLDPVPDGLPRH